MGKQRNAEKLALNLPQLQNLIKRDPDSYKEEFNQQYLHFESELAIFQLKPDQESEHFGNLVMFLCHVATCYPKQSENLPLLLIDLLTEHHSVLAPDLRRSLVQSLVLLRNKDLVTTERLLSLFFILFRCPDKVLRSLLHSHIVTDIKNCNAKGKNNKLNKNFQNFMYKMLKDTNEIAARKSLEVMIDLYKKNVWNDTKTVNVIAEGCFSSNLKVVSIAVHFFLGCNDKPEADPDDEEETLDIATIKHNMSITKKTRSKKTQYDKAVTTIRRKERKSQKAEVFNFSALHLLNDPQGFAEKLFSRLKSSSASIAHKFELRIEMLNLITRLIGVHKLLLLGVYEFLINYLKPSQREVTRILAYTAQSSHELVPPDALEPVVRAIADNFIWGNCSGEVICAGLNGLREICVRCPLAMPESLLQSLLDDYKNHREKGVMMAGRSLLGLFREINPEMLKRKDRGRNASMNITKIQAPQYGAVEVCDTLCGLDMISKPRKVKTDNDNEEESDNEDEWEEVSEVEELEGEQVDGWEGWENASNADEEEEDAEEEEWKSLSVDEGAEDEHENPAPKKETNSLVYEKILTEKDFKKLKSYNIQRKAQLLAGTKRRKTNSGEPEVDIEEMIFDSEDDGDDVQEDDADLGVVNVSSIVSGIKRKNDYNDRLESIKAGREGREKFGSRKALNERTSTTNKEKAKKKNFMMIMNKRSVQGKATKSLRDKQKILRAHVTKQKMKK